MPKLLCNGHWMTPRVNAVGGRTAAHLFHKDQSIKRTSERILFCSMRVSSRTIAKAGLPGLTFVEGYIEVDDVEGMRVQMEGEQPRVEYLVKWKVSQYNSNCFGKLMLI